MKAGDTTYDVMRAAHTGAFEKFTRVTFLGRPLDAEEFAGKVMQSRVEYLKSAGTYTDAEAAAVEEFKAPFKGLTLPPGASVLFTHSPAGAITVSSHACARLFPRYTHATVLR